VESSATATSLTVTWSALTADADTGGLSIISYHLQYDQGTTTWTDLQGFASDSTLLTHTISSLTSGTEYKFRLRAKNSLGYGVYSSEVAMTPAATPSTPSAPVTTLDEPYARITWSAPSDNGSPITSYTITILQQDGSYSEEATYCDGTDPTIISQLYCQVPMISLAASPYSLSYGDNIKAKVSATNSEGTSSESAVTTSFTTLETVPTQMSAVTSGTATDDT